MRAGVVALVLLAGCASRESESILVFAAASLTDVVHALADEFQSTHPAYDVTISVGATSLLARQIGYGAPADVFLAASPDWIEFLEEEGLVSGDVSEIFGNRLVVVGPAEEGHAGRITLVNGCRTHCHGRSLACTCGGVRA